MEGHITQSGLSIPAMIEKIKEKASFSGFKNTFIEQTIDMPWEKNDSIAWPQLKENCFSCQNEYGVRYEKYLSACSNAITNKDRDRNHVHEIFMSTETIFTDITTSIPVCSSSSSRNFENSANCGTVFMTIMDIMHIKFFLKFYENEVSNLGLKKHNNMVEKIREEIENNAKRANYKLQSLGIEHIPLDANTPNETIIARMREALERANQKFSQAQFAVDYKRNEEYDDRGSEINKHAQNYHQETDDSEDDSASFSSDLSHDYQSRWVR